MSIASYSNVTPEQVLTFTAPTQGYLCPFSDNDYGISFYHFTIRDIEDSSKVYFDVQHSPEECKRGRELIQSLSEAEQAPYRRVCYQFPPSLLQKGAISARLVFGVEGNKPLNKFRMIERHYFRNTLIKSYDFDFGFCIPHSTNTWEAIYNLPSLTPEWKEAIIANPNETVSDSFYFVDGRLVQHSKAFYAYNGPEV